MASGATEDTGRFQLNKQDKIFPFDASTWRFFLAPVRGASRTIETTPLQPLPLSAGGAALTHSKTAARSQFFSRNNGPPRGDSAKK